MEIEWTVRAVKDMRRMPGRLRDRIVAKVEQYAAEPSSLANQVKRLAGSDLSRLRIGDHRAIFRIEEGSVTVLVVLTVRHRSEAYE